MGNQRKKVKEKGEQKEFFQTFPDSVKLSAGHWKENDGETAAGTSTQRLGISGEGRPTNTRIQRRQYDGGNLGDWSISLWWQTQAQDKWCPDKTEGMVKNRAFAHTVIETEDFSKHVYKEHNKMADTWQTRERQGGRFREREYFSATKTVGQRRAVSQ